MRALAALALSLVAASPASADGGPIEIAWARYRGAEFQEAIDILDAAEAGGSLAAEDYPRSLEIRALSAHALGDVGTARRALRLLAATDPDYVLGPEAVPDLREALDAERAAGRGRVSLEVSARLSGERARIEARVVRDELELVRRVDVFARAGDRGELARGEGALDIDAAGARTVAYFAEAVGPAGLVVARAGSAAHPRYIELDDEGLGAGFWIAVVAGAALLAAGAVVATLALAKDDDRIAIDGPMLPF